MGSDAGAAASLIAECFEREDPETRYQAAHALASVGPSARAALPALKRINQEQDTMFQNAVRRAIAAIESQQPGN